jgi:hypothetical protein
MREIGGPVKWIDIPAVFAAAIIESLFLAHDVVGWELLGDTFADQHLGGPIGCSDQIRIAFVLYLEALMKVLKEQSACLARDGGHGWDQVLALACGGWHE